MTDKTEHVPGELSQAEKLSTLLNDLRVARERNASTLAQFAQSEFDEPRGRFTTTEKATVIGVSPPSYPEQPPNSPFRSDPCGQEPPLGFSVNEMPPCGEAHEIRASIAAQELGSSVSRVQAPPSSAPDDAALAPDARRDAGLGLSDQQDDDNA